MSSKIKLLFLILIFCFGAVGFIFLKGKNFFTFNLSNLLLLGKKGSLLTTQFTEYKEKYGSKKWQGTVNGEITITMPDSYLFKSYTLQINEMRINFDAPETGSYTRLYPGAPRISIDGDAVLESALWGVTGTKIDVYVASYPFKLDGVIDFVKGTIDFNAEEPYSQETFSILYIPDDPLIPPYSGDDATLSDIFDPKTATFRFEGDKIIFTGLGIPTSNSKGNVSGTLNPF